MGSEKFLRVGLEVNLTLLSPPADGTMPHHRGYLRLLAAFCLTFLFLTFTASYKPVIVVHGLFDSPSDFQLLLNFINEVSGGGHIGQTDGG